MNKQKRSFIVKPMLLAACIFLSSCASFLLDEQQAMVMPAGDLCTFEINFGYSEVARNAIASRKLDCEKIIVAESKKVIPTLNNVELCTAENTNPIPVVYPLIQKEIVKRKLDCLSFIQSQQQITIAQQQAASERRYQEEVLRLQRNEQMLSPLRNISGSGGACSSFSIPPIPAIGCKSVCINGSWASVC